jgi:hypothetical protein
VLHCYSQLVGTIEIESGERREEPVAMATPDDDDQAAIGQIWIETTSYLLGRRELTPDTWTMVSVLSVHSVDSAICRLSLTIHKYGADLLLEISVLK